MTSMSETASQEPTMEEILASIRRIISEDETPATPEGETAGAPVVADEGDDEPEAEMLAAPDAEVEVEAEPEIDVEPEALAAALEPEAEPEEDVLELTETVVASS